MLNRDRYEMLAAELDDAMTADEIIDWTLRRIQLDRLVITTGFGMEGCALIDMFASRGVGLAVAYLDTHLLFPETYELRDRLVSRYPAVRFECFSTALSLDDQAAAFGAELWRSNPDLCCHLRKVEPLHAALADAHAWVTALTRSQSPGRASTQIQSWDSRYQLLKLAPLATWNRVRVWEYVRRHGVPYNPLHERGYPSIGCIHCTRQVASAKVTDYSREGRWAGLEKKECGLHVPAARNRVRSR